MCTRLTRGSRRRDQAGDQRPLTALLRPAEPPGRNRRLTPVIRGRHRRCPKHSDGDDRGARKPEPGRRRTTDRRGGDDDQHHAEKKEPGPPASPQGPRQPHPLRRAGLPTGTAGKPSAPGTGGTGGLSVPRRRDRRIISPVQQLSGAARSANSSPFPLLLRARPCLTPPSLPARCVQIQFCDLSFGVLPGAVCRRIDVVTCEFTPTPLPVQPGCPAQQSDNRGQEEQQIDHHDPRRRCSA
jgi:hypothetical protein